MAVAGHGGVDDSPRSCPSYRPVDAPSGARGKSTRVATGTAPSARHSPSIAGSRRGARACCRCTTFTSCSPCPRSCARGCAATAGPCSTRCSEPPPTRCASSGETRAGSAGSSGSPRCCTPGPATCRGILTCTAWSPVVASTTTAPGVGHARASSSRLACWADCSAASTSTPSAVCTPRARSSFTARLTRCATPSPWTTCSTSSTARTGSPTANGPLATPTPCSPTSAATRTRIGLSNPSAAARGRRGG